MPATQIVFAQSAVLVAMGVWGYLGAERRSVTALIPVLIGLLIGGLGLKVADSRTIAYVIIGVSILAIVALRIPLKSAIGRESMIAVFRISTMILITGASLFSVLKDLTLMNDSVLG